MYGLRTKALAMIKRWRWPPEKILPPLPPHGVSKPIRYLAINSVEIMLITHHPVVMLQNRRLLPPCKLL
jgi:hypothetical protein